MKKYQPKQIEQKWQEKWQESHIYDFKNDPAKKKFYTLVELPYTSGDLHVGHWFSWTTPDIYSRYLRMSGYDVFFPHGYDTTGLPAENAAIKRGIHPRDWTMGNIETMQKQFHTMGSMVNLEDIHIACSDEYMKWNQWIFLKMYEKGIAYRGKRLSNWCPVDQTVLADEHVVDGKCWRCDSQVEQKEIAQWFLKITHYADDLIWPTSAGDSEGNELKTKNSKLKTTPSIDWPLSVRTGQNNWIGRSPGMRVKFDDIEVFTTRPETIDGATFVVLSPEHPLVGKYTADSQKEIVEAYCKDATSKNEIERTGEKKKTGVWTGGYVQNPVTQTQIPVWIGDYVLMNYGTGAIMAVPVADERDAEFAKTYDLPIIPTSFEAKPEGVAQVNYHIRDWSVSRQRYWGTPVPIIHCDDCAQLPVPEKDLPVTLPYEVDFTPRGKAPLATNEEWMKVECPKCHKPAMRDPETLDTFFDSAWYFFRYLNNHYKDGPFDTQKAAKMMPVDVYFGGAEHTLGHTLYARFFTKFFKDLGFVEFDEFATRRVQHGIVLGPDHNKMSKSKGNVINPDLVVQEYGTDTVRMYLAFMMPYEGTGPWSDEAVAGMYRFLQRVWKLAEKVESSTSHQELSAEDTYQMNRAISDVTRDLSNIKSNTALAFVMTWVNHLSKRATITKQEYETLLLLLSPFAPHITEELWTEIGNEFSIHNQTWPIADEKGLKGVNVHIPIQINGKVRAVIEVAPSVEESELLKKALALDVIKKYLDAKSYKSIYVPGKILNIIITS